jgi:hypothetical protein
LPACIAPRRWYDWAAQQALLLCLLAGASLRAAARSCHIDRHTGRRWRDWLGERGEHFAFHLRSRFPQWGRATDVLAFWRMRLTECSLQALMARLDHDLIIP